MIFMTSNHYDINKYAVLTTKETHVINCECFICYEIKDKDNLSPTKFGTQRKYFKTCVCDVIVHISCLDEWYNFHNSCPICRKYIKINPEQNRIICIFDYFYYIRNSTIVFIRIVCLILSVYYFTNVLFVICLLAKSFFEKNRVTR